MRSRFPLSLSPSSLFGPTLERLARASDVLLAVVAAAIVAALIVPLPGWLLDLGIALNLTAGALLLFAGLYAKEALRVASFPTLILLTTLFRLAMNVSSTRLALTEGHAGSIIGAFGEFVIRGDYLVGAILFAILTLVQFLVVAKGAERVAEVGARFSLDAMPGKQMAIDAELRTGAVDQAEARRRRRALERESQLYGAMDGAMKFIKGDVIAGLIIVLVVLLGGLVSGMLSGMSPGEALETYALLAIGDGLVSQIPSLCVALAAGLVVTRVSAEHEGTSLAREIGQQFLSTPNALYVVSGLLGALALLPGMPPLIFLGLAGLLSAGALGLERLRAAEPEATSSTEAGTAEMPGAPAIVLDTGLVRLALVLGRELTPLVEEGAQALARVDLMQLRERIFESLGLAVPPIHVRTGAEGLAAGHYSILLDEVPVASGRLVVGGGLVLASEHECLALGLKGTLGADPRSGAPAVWLPEAELPSARAAGMAVLSGREVLCLHVERVLRRRSGELLGIQEVQGLVESFERWAPALVKEVLTKVSLPLLAEVLRRLLEEEVSVRNLRAIFEALVSPSTEGDAAVLVERCRQALRRDISQRYAPHGALFAYLVDPAVEQELRAPGGGALSPERLGAILEGAKRVAEGGARDVVLLASPDIRRTLRRLCEHPFPNVAVLTYAELEPHLQVRPLGRLVACA